MKKFIFLVAFLQIGNSGFSQTSVYSGSNVFKYAGSAELNNPIPTEGNKIEVGTTPYPIFNANINKQVIACTEIILKPNTQLHAPSDPTKSLDLSIVDGKLDIYSYTHTDFSQIHALEKFETGLELPSEISERIAALKLDDNDPNGLNPFLEWDVNVKITYTHLSSGYSHFNYGFYFEDWQRQIVGSDYNKPNWKWKYTANSNEYRVRYAFPELNGKWKIEYELFVEGELYYAYCPFNVEVIDKHPGDGFVKVAENKRVLERDNDLFFPIGHNMVWPDKYLRPKIGLPGQFEEVHCAYDPTGEPCESAAHFAFDQKLQDFANSGNDYFRILLSPSSFDIEFEKMGNYFERLNYANEIDKVIQFATENDMYVDFNMLVHYGLVNGPVYGLFAWDGSSEHALGFDDAYAEKKFCYVSDLNLSSPKEFLTNVDAKKYYKQKLRYLLSRWGYSTHIALFELMSEINQVGDITETIYDFPNDTIVQDTTTWWKFSQNVSVYNPYNSEATHRQNTYLWQKEMAEYIKNELMHKNHLLTCGYAGNPKADDPTFSIPELDVMAYNYGNARNLNFVQSIQNDLRTYKNLYDKPIVFSETGPLEELACDNHTSYSQLLWQTAFSGVAGFNYWDGQYNDYAAEWVEMKKLKDWIINDPVKKEILLSNWDVGHSNGPVRGEVHPYYRKDFNYIYEVNPVINPSLNTRRAFGALLNLTDNYYTNATSDTTDCNTGEGVFVWMKDRKLTEENENISNLNKLTVKNNLSTVIDQIIQPWVVYNSSDDDYISETLWYDLSTLNQIPGYYTSENISNQNNVFNHPTLFVIGDSVTQLGLRNIIPFESQFVVFSFHGISTSNSTLHSYSNFAVVKDNESLKIVTLDKDFNGANNEDKLNNPNQNSVYNVLVTNTIGQTVFSGEMDFNLNNDIPTNILPKGMLIITLVNNNEKHTMRWLNL